MSVNVRESEEHQIDPSDSVASLSESGVPLAPNDPSPIIQGNDQDGSQALTLAADDLSSPSKLYDENAPIPGIPQRFVIEQIGVDRRLLVNRKRQLKMYRVWMQAKFRKGSPR